MVAHSLWTIVEASAVLGVGPGTLYAWVKLGKVRHLTVKGVVLVDGLDLDELIDMEDETNQS